MIAVLGIPNPLNLPGDLVRAIGLAIDQGISSASSWAVQGMIRALTATTSVDLGGWFSGPWSAMLVLAALASGGVLLVAVIHGALSGRAGELARRGLLAPLGVAVLAGPGALGAAGALIEATSAACGLVEGLALGPGGFGAALGRLPTQVGAGLPGAPLVVGALMAIAVGLVCFVIWVELAIRAGAIYLVVAFLPLGIAGLFWAPAARWLRRLVEVLVAVVLSQLVITVVMVLAAADLAHGGTGTGAESQPADTLVTSIALLGLGSFSLPMALRLVPHAAEVAHLHGGGSRAVGSATRAVSSDSKSAPALSRLTGAAATGGAAGLAAVGMAVGAGALRRGLAGGAAIADPGQSSHAGSTSSAPGTSNGSRPGPASNGAPSTSASTNGAAGRAAQPGPAPPKASQQSGPPRRPPRPLGGGGG